MIVLDHDINPESLKACKLIGRCYKRWVNRLIPFYKFKYDFDIILTDDCGPSPSGYGTIANYRPDKDAVFVNCPLAFMNAYSTLQKFKHPFIGLLAHELQHREQCKLGRLHMIMEDNRRFHLLFDGVRYPLNALFRKSVRFAPWEIEADAKADAVLKQIGY